MNTKQILYNALTTQLEVKKTECDTYNNEVYTPAFDELSESISEWFTSKINSKFVGFEFTGDKITFNTDNSSSWRDVSFVIRGWDANKYVELDWSGENAQSSNQSTINKGILIGELATNFHLVENRFKTDWYPAYVNIINARREYFKDYENLESALRNLKNEIWNDSVESMKQIGFEIKSFKPNTSLDWEYGDNSERTYKIKICSKSFSLQYGRSQYDTTYVNGYKILGKKGNKYNVEVYREGDLYVRNYDVLEKKMEDFINKVNTWENRDADETKKKVEERYIEYIK
jgi:hypothetical protein